MIRSKLNADTAGPAQPARGTVRASIADASATWMLRFDMWLWMLCATAVVLGIWLRLDGLTRRSLWADEVATLARIRFDSLSGVMADAAMSPFPPLYYMALWTWTRFCGATDVAVRAFSALQSVAALLALVVVWRPLLSGRAMAWALAILSLNAWQIWYSQDAKMYSLVFLLSLISGGLFARILHAPNGSRGIVWMLAGVNGILLGVSYVGIVVPVSQFLYALGLFVRRNELRTRLLEVAGASLVGLAPLALWLPYAIDAAASRRGIGWIPKVSCWETPSELYALTVVFWTGIRPHWSMPDSLWTACLLIVHAPPIFVTLLAINLFRRRPQAFQGQILIKDVPTAFAQRDVHYYLVWWAIAPVIGTLAFSLTIYSLWGVPRFLMTVCPAWLIGTALVIAESRPAPLTTVTGIVLLIANLLTLGFDRTHMTRTPWREATIALGHVAATPTGETSIGRAPPALRLFAQQPREFAWEPVQHALAIETASVEVQQRELTIDTQVGSDEKFVVISYGIDSHVELFHGQFPAHEVRQLYSAVVYEDLLTAMPAPYGPRCLHLWLVAPSGR